MLQHDAVVIEINGLFTAEVVTFEVHAVNHFKLLVYCLDFLIFGWLLLPALTGLLRLFIL